MILPAWCTTLFVTVWKEEEEKKDFIVRINLRKDHMITSLVKKKTQLTLEEWGQEEEVQ